jgi:hypothetical protein
MNPNDNTTPQTELLPLMGYSPVWFWIISFIVITAILIWVFFLLFLEPKAKPRKEKAPHKLTYVKQMDEIFNKVNNQQLDYHNACLQVSLLLKSYLTRVAPTNPPMNIETATLQELQRLPVAPKLLEAIEYVYPIVYQGYTPANHEQFTQFMNASRSILDGSLQ